VSTLSKYFAGLAILISCLGLFGLAAFTAQRRIKEIGIRKISAQAISASCGCSQATLPDDFHCHYDCPTAELFYHTEMACGFAYRIDLEWWFFAGSGCLALVIALFTVALQTVRASRVNPTECLKQE